LPNTIAEKAAYHRATYAVTPPQVGVSQYGTGQATLALPLGVTVTV